MDFGRLLCSLGLHRVVTTREGKQTSGGGRSGSPRISGAANHIHVFCYRPHCTFRTIIDTHDGAKIDPQRDRA